jgi:hypothetical protein
MLKFKRGNVMIKNLTIIITLFFLSGCATIMHGDSQYIEINSEPQAATAYVDGNYFTTPATVLLKRGHHIHKYQIRVQKEGYKPAYATVELRLSKWLWGDIIWLVVPGVLVDAITGAAFNLYPSQITVRLEESAK